jgi:hypothetical protein
MGACSSAAVHPRVENGIQPKSAAPAPQLPKVIDAAIGLQSPVSEECPTQENMFDVYGLLDTVKVVDAADTYNTDASTTVLRLHHKLKRPDSGTTAGSDNDGTTVTAARAEDSAWSFYDRSPTGRSPVVSSMIHPSAEGARHDAISIVDAPPIDTLGNFAGFDRVKGGEPPINMNLMEFAQLTGAARALMTTSMSSSAAGGLVYHESSD